jgi:hypothetical protein
MGRKPIKLTKEKILETVNTTPEERLNWLEEANSFIAKIKYK